jgi:hypothetical protein
MRSGQDRVGGDGASSATLGPCPTKFIVRQSLPAYELILYDGAQEEERANRRGGQQRLQLPLHRQLHRQRQPRCSSRLEERLRVDQEAGERALDIGPHHLPQQVGGSLIGAPVACAASNPLTTGIGATSRPSTGPGCSSRQKSSSRSHTATTSRRARTPSIPPSSTTSSRSARPSTRPPIWPCVRPAGSPRPR